MYRAGTVSSTLQSAKNTPKSTALPKMNMKCVNVVSLLYLPYRYSILVFHRNVHYVIYVWQNTVKYSRQSISQCIICVCVIQVYILKTILQTTPLCCLNPSNWQRMFVKIGKILWQKEQIITIIVKIASGGLLQSSMQHCVRLDQYVV